jgi:hypothetical protein
VAPVSFSQAILSEVPDPEAIALRLAVVSTERQLLKAQLKVSNRAARERERLRQLHAGDRQEESRGR